MNDKPEDLEGPAAVTLEGKVDRLVATVDAAFVEQRGYTEFAFDQLKEKMDAGFADIAKHLGDMDGRFGEMGSRFARIERKLDQWIDLHLPQAAPRSNPSQ